MNFIPYYIVIIESYDYFGGHKFEHYNFKTLIEAWNFFKSNLKYAYHYDDGSFCKINKPILDWKFEKSRHIYHNIRKEKKITSLITENIFDTNEELFFEDDFNINEVSFVKIDEGYSFENDFDPTEEDILI